MKNQEIIANAAVRSGILKADEVKMMLETKQDIPLHTAQGWRLRGKYQIKEGEIPIEVKLWKKNKDGKFYLAKAKLYHFRQIEPSE